MNQLGGASHWEETGGSPARTDTSPVSGEAGFARMRAPCKGKGLGKNFFVGFNFPTSLGSERGIPFSLSGENQRSEQSELLFF